MSEAFDPVDFVAGTIAPLAQYTFPFICSIVGIESENAGEHVGSAVRLGAGRKRFLITAKHVLDQAHGFRLGAGFVETRGAPPVRLLPGTQLADVAADVALVTLEDAEGDSGDFFPAERIDPDPTAREHDFLFVHGFPGERARFIFGESHHRSLPYGVMERDDDLPPDKSEFEFGMDYDPRNMRLESAALASLVMPAGLSGSPVWRIGAYRQKPELWTPRASQLVGIVTRWNQEKRVLLATEIGRVRALVDGLGQQAATPQGALG